MFYGVLRRKRFMKNSAVFFDLFCLCLRSVLPCLRFVLPMSSVCFACLRSVLLVSSVCFVCIFGLFCLCISYVLHLSSVCSACFFGLFCLYLWSALPVFGVFYLCYFKPLQLTYWKVLKLLLHHFDIFISLFSSFIVVLAVVILLNFHFTTRLFIVCIISPSVVLHWHQSFILWYLMDSRKFSQTLRISSLACEFLGFDHFSPNYLWLAYLLGCFRSSSNYSGI